MMLFKRSTVLPLVLILLCISLFSCMPKPVEVAPETEVVPEVTEESEIEAIPEVEEALETKGVPEVAEVEFETEAIPEVKEESKTEVVSEAKGEFSDEKVSEEKKMEELLSEDDISRWIETLSMDYIMKLPITERTVFVFNLLSENSQITDKEKAFSLEIFKKAMTRRNVLKFESIYVDTLRDANFSIEVYTARLCWAEIIKSYFDKSIKVESFFEMMQKLFLTENEYDKVRR